MGGRRADGRSAGQGCGLPWTQPLGLGCVCSDCSSQCPTGQREQTPDLWGQVRGAPATPQLMSLSEPTVFFVVFFLFCFLLEWMVKIKVSVLDSIHGNSLSESCISV